MAKMSGRRRIGLLLENETLLGGERTMRTVMSAKQVAIVEEDVRLQFARQLYDKCLERHGEDHEETRLVLKHISRLESRVSPRRGEANHHYMV
jgi:hypothetical protein